MFQAINIAVKQFHPPATRGANLPYEVRAQIRFASLNRKLHQNPNKGSY